MPVKILSRLSVISNMTGVGRVGGVALSAEFWLSARLQRKLVLRGQLTRVDAIVNGEQG